MLGDNDSKCIKMRFNKNSEAFRKDILLRVRYVWYLSLSIKYRKYLTRYQHIMKVSLKLSLSEGKGSLCKQHKIDKLKETEIEINVFLNLLTINDFQISPIVWLN